MSDGDAKAGGFSYSGSVLDDLLNDLSGGKAPAPKKAAAPQKAQQPTPPPAPVKAAPAAQEVHSHNGHRERVREKFIGNKLKFDNFSEHEIIELLLYYCIPRCDVNELSHRIVRKFGGFTGVLNAPYAELIAVTGLGEQSALYLKILMRLCAKYNLEMQRRVSVTNAESLFDYMVYQFAGESKECAKLYLVDENGKVGTPFEIGRGLEERSVFDFKKTMNIISNSSAKSILLAHSHEKTAAPSDNDVIMTRRFRQMLDPIGVTLIDHFVVRDSDVASMRKLGLLDL